MGSRIRENPAHIFSCFCEIVLPNENEKKAWILQKFPDDFDNQEILKPVPQFACPCDFSSSAIQHFSFVLTSLDSTWTFGYCRQVPKTQTLIVILSLLPWHETFYKILNQIADLTNSKDSHLLPRFLEAVYNSPVPEPGFNLHVSYGLKEFIVYCPNHLKLPSIPENRNLTEYFNAIDAHNMMVIFASMLHERRILVTSKKLSRLSACVQAANALIYPMHWQHIFIPVLPMHLIDYLSAPMPFLIGVPSATMMKFRQSELSEVVILDADNNRVRTPFNDLETLPHEIVSSLKRSLKNPNLMLGDGVSRAFMRALVQLIGGYRDSLKFTLGQKISFDADTFIKTRPASIQPFLETMLQLQIFQQFIEDRLDMLNSGTGFSDEFEYEVNSYEVYSSNNLRTQYKEWVTTMKKEGGAFLKNVKSKTNPAVKHAYKNVKDKSKRAYKDLRSKIQDIQKHPNQSDMRFSQRYGKPKSAPSSPTLPHPNRYGNKTMSYNQNNIRKGGVLEAMTLPNSMSVSGIRHYKMLTVDEISAVSEESLFEGGENLKRLDMDLMGDLNDMIYRRCSVSSDNLNSLGLENTVKQEKAKASVGFADSFCNSNGIVCTPVAPPRTKKNAKPLQKSNTMDSVLTQNANSQEPVALIQFESLDDVALFDPLKEDNAKDTELLPFITSKTSGSDTRVEQLKNTIQNLALAPAVYPLCNQPGPYFIPNSYYPPRAMAPIAPLSTLPQHPNSSALKHAPFGTFNKKPQDKRPPLPPKTRVSSTFFVGTGELSKTDHDLLDDYGLGSSPIFNQNNKGDVSSNCDWTATPSRNSVNSNSLFPLDNEKAASPCSTRKDLKVQSSWQKFA